MVDVTAYKQIAVTDTCSVWNVLSSSTLFRQAISAGCSFSMTHFVRYECLDKLRKEARPEDAELKARLEQARRHGHFPDHAISIGDLQEVARLRQRRSISLGELSSIAFAGRTAQAFQTDDVKARRLAAEYRGDGFVQTTPQLVGWLTLLGRIIDSDMRPLVEEHQRFGRSLAQFFRQMHEEGLRCRLAANS